MPARSSAAARRVSPEAGGRARQVTKRRNPAIDEYKAEYETYIGDGMARYLWISAFADWAEGAELVQAADGPAAFGTSGVEWDEISPDTPPAAERAAADLIAMFVVSEKLAGPTPMTELFEHAMVIDQGKWDFGPEVETLDLDKKTRQMKWVTGTHEGTGLPLAYEFGSMMAAEALGQGVGWGDDHNVKDDAGRKFDPSVPNFECHYDGEYLTWSGGHEVAPHWRRIGEGEDDYADQVTVGRITVVNPGDRDAWSRTHRYVFWFDAHAPLYLMAYGDFLNTALDICVDWLEEQNLPGYFIDDEVNEEYARLVAEGMDEDRARDEAEANTTIAGNHGRMLNSEDWGVEADNPTDAQLHVIGRVQEQRDEAAAQREYNRRAADLQRPRIWVGSISANDAALLLAGGVDSLRLVPRERHGQPAGGDYGEAAFGLTSADLDIDYAIQYLLALGPLEPRWNTGDLAGAFVPRTWYLGPDIDGTRRTFVLENFSHDQQRAVYEAVASANRKAEPVKRTRQFEDTPQFRIAITYETVTPCPHDDDEAEVEQGWIDEEGVIADNIDDAVRMLRHDGPLEPSSTIFHENLYYTQADDDENYQTGARTRRSYHLRGFSAQQQRVVYDDLKRLKVLS